jgi:hypothetical protein
VAAFWYVSPFRIAVKCRQEGTAMQTVTLSEAALTLLRRRLAGERVEITDENRPLYQELVGGGMMIPLHSFARGSEGAYRLVEDAFERANALSILSPSA